MKRLIAVIVIFLGLVVAGSLPNDARFDAPVTLRTGPAGMSLEAVLDGAARSVKLTPILKEIPDSTIKLDWVNKPFRQLWNLLINTYGEGKLDYSLLKNDVILVAPPEVIARTIGTPKAAPSPKQAVSLLREFYKIPWVDPKDPKKIEDLAKFLQDEVKGIVATAVPGQMTIAVQGSKEQQKEVQSILERLSVQAANKPQTGTAPTKKPPANLIRKFYAIPSGDPGKVAEFLNGEIKGIAATVVPGQRTIAVRGTEEQQKEVQNILAQIITPPVKGPPIFQRTFRLSNARAKDVAEVISSAMAAQKAASAPAEGAAQQNQEQTAGVASTLNIAADERTNTLVVTGTAKDLQMVEDLVKKLDFAIEQVNVQVRIQEVTQTLIQNLGIKWNTISGGNVVSSILDSGLSLIFDATRSLASLNIVATLNALEKQGLSKTVNDSNITVLDNHEGLIQSGSTIFIKRVRGDKVEKVPYEVGVIIKVTPQITADKQIVLYISSEVSAIKERNPVDGDVDVIAKQKSDTVLRIKNGDTIVLGGLIKTKRDQNTQGVPVLMNIPILGNLFKQTRVDNSDSELLIVITANIVNSSAKKVAESSSK